MRRFLGKNIPWKINEKRLSCHISMAGGAKWTISHRVWNGLALALTKPWVWLHSLLWLLTRTMCTIIFVASKHCYPFCGTNKHQNFKKAKVPYTVLCEPWSCEMAPGYWRTANKTAHSLGEVQSDRNSLASFWLQYAFNRPCNMHVICM